MPVLYEAFMIRPGVDMVKSRLEVESAFATRRLWKLGAGVAGGYGEMNPGATWFRIRSALRGRLTQRESACLTSKTSQVQILYRPPFGP